VKKLKRKKLKLKKIYKNILYILIFYILVCIFILAISNPKDRPKGKIDIFGNVETIGE